MKSGVLFRSFLGGAPAWYKRVILALLIANPFLLIAFGPVVTGWLMLFEFIFVLAMTLQCYPLQPGGLIALESIVIGLTRPETVYAEVLAGYPVILLLVFMVAGVFFLKEMLLHLFTRLLLSVRSKAMLGFLFCFSAALLSAFLDALTVIAVVMAVGTAFYAVYHRVATGRAEEDEHDVADDARVDTRHGRDLEGLRAFLRSLMMHAAVGTTLGGVCTLVGEPQNLLVAERAGWDFQEFFVKVAPVSLPVLVVGLLVCPLLEMSGRFGYGAPLPAAAREVLAEFDRRQMDRRDALARLRLWIQGLVALLMAAALAFHVAEVGIIGLFVIVLATALTGVVEEHRLGDAFTAALPFTALLVVFFVIVAFIHEQHLFTPVMQAVLAQDGRAQVAMFYLANGALSAISDNVFVATLLIDEVVQALRSGAVDHAQFERLVVALNTGVNIPSIATPNGQAAFLFILSSALAPLIRLSYGRMVWMAFPYFLAITPTGLLAILIVL